MIIYQITNEVNGKFYIGKTTKSIEERFEKHIYESRYNRSGSYLHKSMKKYGVEHYNIKVIESQVDEAELDERERYWIGKLNPHYNLTEGGEGGDTSSSPQFIQSMEEYHKRKPREEYATYGMLGKQQSQKCKDRTREANSKPISIEGVVYPSITEGQKQHPGVKVRYRIKSPNYPDWHYLPS
tara:strand:- start:45 stop:593 length:549 start_codon:yes stop_codon:yes gene_type:complete